MADGLRERLARRIASIVDEPEQVVDDMFAWLRLVAEYPDRQFSPTRAVDVGWHEFILHTRDYADWCQENAGRFIHHVPNEASGDCSGQKCYSSDCSNLARSPDGEQTTEGA